MVWMLVVALVVITAVVIVLVFRKKTPELPAPPAAPRPRPVLDKGPPPPPPEARAKGSAEPRPLTGAAAGQAKPRPAPLGAAAEAESARAGPPPPPPSRPSAEEMASLKRGLATARGGFVGKLKRLFGGSKEIDPALLAEIEEVLLGADVGVKTTQRILDRLRDRMSRRELTDSDKVWAALRDEAEQILGVARQGLNLSQRPAVILVIGVNGVGKTTTIGKLASRLTSQGKKVVLAAGDTFRAAAVLQLEVWGKRTGCIIVKGKENADPSSVVFDAVKRAQSEQADVLIVDTAGRLHTKAPLMDELKKIGRTVEKAAGRAADEILLVLDATNGQNAREQSQLFGATMGVTGLVLTKLDGTAKGGVVLGIVDEQRLPIRFIGIGERVEDLRECETSSFVEALFDREADEAGAA